MMEPVPIKCGELVLVSDLHLSSPFFKDGISLRVTGKLQEYCVEIAIAVLVNGKNILRVATQHVSDVSFRVGSTYQFIGELHVHQNNEVILQARVGRNVDGIDFDLYHQTLQLLRQFLADHKISS